MTSKMEEKQETKTEPSKPDSTVKPEPPSPSDARGGWRGGRGGGGRGGGGRGIGSGMRGGFADKGGLRSGDRGMRGGLADRGRGGGRGGGGPQRGGMGPRSSPNVKSERDGDRGRSFERGFPRNLDRSFDRDRDRGGRNLGPGGHGGPGGPGGAFGGPGETQRMLEEELQVKREPKKFIGRCRLFIGNLPNTMTEEKFKELFKEYGETTNVYFNRERGFGLISLEYLHHAQKAKLDLDGKVVEGAHRPLRVRFSSHSAALRVKHLAPTVTNEFLEKAFSMFGKVERAVVACNEQGRSLGEGIVEFERKNAAQMALQRINDGAFLLTPGPRPIAVEPIESRDEDDGFSEDTVKKNNEYYRDREAVPRFAAINTFDHEFSQRWKQLYELEKQQRDQLESQIKEARERLLDEESFAVKDWQTQQLRRELEERQRELARMEEMHMAERVRRDEMRKRHMEDEQNRFKHEMVHREMMMGGMGGGGMNREEEMMMRREEEMRRREEEMMRMRGGGRGGGGRGMGPGAPRGIDDGLMGPGGRGDGLMGPGGRGGDGILGPGGGMGNGLVRSPEDAKPGMKGVKDEPSPQRLMGGGMPEPANKRSRWN